jgi:hypothetical protein
MILVWQEAERQAALYAALDSVANKSANDTSFASISASMHRMPTRSNPQLMPGPWGFLTSWYAVGLFAMVCPCAIFSRAPR